MNLFSRKTVLEVVTSIFVNLTSGWFGVLLISPGLSSGITVDIYLKSLFSNLQYGIFGLIVSLVLTQRCKSL
ncbi:MAG: hypothetical protein UR54_C0002G0012 [Candidatus Roizmanbacteria bacterium GW2011_GWA2_34_18]|uniref:Uncharacterized protein n=1 Tax=Candidatus Roizmanbacteria bacterium GW2011_GWA2_34_18 TaxID=1618477 RepID=A0A0G0AW20_9BACT|nr:MAG: hypothetical protein UR54_C0002G0012 [Candidatus Roizmanbacteria bacterium GW2011_GWA2_34_18]